MTVIVYPNAEALAKMTVARLCLALADAGSLREQVHVAVAGGSVGTNILGALADSDLAEEVDWHTVHIWWVDERFVPTGDDDRNDTVILEQLGRLPIPVENIHAMPATDTVADLAAGVTEYAAELKRFAGEEQASPVFDVVLLGMGPDGHIASIFPGHEGLTAGSDGATVFSVDDSPKPPAERLSLTMEAITNAREIWVAAWGQEKAPAIARAVGRGSVDETPAAGVAGHPNALWLTDIGGASEL